MKLQEKALAFYVALKDLYKDDGERNEIPKIEFHSNATEDMTAMLIALSFFYSSVTGDKSDLIGFTHILNRLAMQYVFDNEDEQ